MTMWLLAAMTLGGLVILGAWFSGRRIVIARTGDVFMLAWFYYGFAVAIDILLGLEIQGVPGMTDFSDPASQELILHVLAYYLMCGGAFCIAYSGVKRLPHRASRPNDLILPPISALVAVHVLLLVMLYQAGYFGLTRPQRILLTSESWALRLLMLTSSLLRALDCVIIIFSTQKKQVMLTTLVALALGLASGGRMEVMAVLLILVLKYRVSFGRLKFAAAVVAMLAAFACWKSAYHYVYACVYQQVADGGILEFANTSLSGIDSYASSLIAVTVLEDECPYFLGRTYVYDVAQAALPSEWRDPGFLPLSQTFDWDYVPERAEEGISLAFSAIAEAWLNFGIVGPILLGIVFGAAAKAIDTQSRGIVFYIFALMAFRLFRSDLASLCKSWIIIYGGAMFACYGACVLVTYVLHRQRRGEAALRRVAPRRLAGSPEQR